MYWNGQELVPLYYVKWDIIKAYYLFFYGHNWGQGTSWYDRLRRIKKYYHPEHLSIGALSENAQNIFKDLVNNFHYVK
jgi:hypothetical protein